MSVNITSERQTWKLQKELNRPENSESITLTMPECTLEKCGQHSFDVFVNSRFIQEMD